MQSLFQSHLLYYYSTKKKYAFHMKQNYFSQMKILFCKKNRSIDFFYYACVSLKCLFETRTKIKVHLTYLSSILLHTWSHGYYRFVK